MAHFRDSVASSRRVQFEDVRAGTHFLHDFFPVLDAQGRVTCVASFSRDITEQKRAEVALRESEQTYRALIETTGTGYLILDMQGLVVDANTEYVRLSGHQTLPEILGRNVVEWTAAYDQQRNSAEVAHCLKNGAVRNLEVDYSGPNGCTVPVEVNATVVQTHKGTRVLSLCRDISERKKAEQHLAETLDLNRTMIAASAVGISAHQASGPCVFANEALARMVNGSVDLLLQQDFREIKSWQNSGLLALALATLGDGQSHSAEFHLTTTFGKELWTECIMVRFFLGGTPHLLLMAHDISERKKAEEALRESEQRLRQVIEASPIPLSIDGLDGTIEYVNRKFVETFGYEPSDLSSSARWFELAYPDPEYRRLIQAKWTAARQQDLRANRDFGPLEVEVTCKDGTVRTVEFLGTRMGERLLVAAKDLTERKQAEAALRTNEAMLRAFFDSPGVPRGIVELLEDDVLLVTVNSAMAVGYSRSLEQMQLCPASQLGVDPDTLRLWIARFQESRQTGKAVSYEYFNRWVVPPRWSFVTACHIGQAPSGVDRFAFVLVDITERKKAEATLKELPAHILEVQEAERQRMARELHDGVNQLLATTKFRLHDLEDSLPRLKPEAREALARCRELLAEALEETRRISHALRPRVLDDLGLGAACNNLCTEFQTRTGIVVQYDSSSIVKRLPVSSELHLFRILQESLQNVAEHSGATQVRVLILQRGRFGELKVEDNGRGFDPAAPRPAASQTRGQGLTNMRERATALGGTCDIQSVPGRGTRVLVRLPLDTSS